MVNAKTCLSCFSVCFVILLIVGLSLFGASFKVIDYNQAALRKNKFSVQIDQTSIYFSGRYIFLSLSAISPHIPVISLVLQVTSSYTIQPGRQLFFLKDQRVSDII